MTKREYLSFNMPSEEVPSYGMPDDVLERLTRVDPIPMDVRATYRYRNADKWREYMKLYMRGYRRRHGRPDKSG